VISTNIQSTEIRPHGANRIIATAQQTLQSGISEIIANDRFPARETITMIGRDSMTQLSDNISPIIYPKERLKSRVEPDIKIIRAFGCHRTTMPAGQL